MGGSSSPSRHAGTPNTVTSVLVPTNGTGANSNGTSVGGGIVNLMKSPVFTTKSAGKPDTRKNNHTQINKSSRGPGVAPHNTRTP